MKNCPVCQRDGIDEHAKKCPQCGSDLECFKVLRTLDTQFTNQLESPSKIPPTPSQKSQRTYPLLRTWISIGALCVLMLFFWVYTEWYFKKQVSESILAALTSQFEISNRSLKGDLEDLYKKIEGTSTKIHQGLEKVNQELGNYAIERESSFNTIQEQLKALTTHLDALDARINQIKRKMAFRKKPSQKSIKLSQKDAP